MSALRFNPAAQTAAFAVSWTSAVDPLQTLETSRPQKTIMMLRDYFLQFLEFEKWANQRVVDYLEKHPEDKRSLKVFCHLIADIEPWLELIEEGHVPSEHFDEQMWSPPECKTRQKSMMQRLSHCVETTEEQSFLKEITSYGSDGDPHKNTIAEILGHIFSHSQHHRGQLELLIEEFTNTYTNLGYMYYLRNTR